MAWQFNGHTYKYVAKDNGQFGLAIQLQEDGGVVSNLFSWGSQGQLAIEICKGADKWTAADEALNHPQNGQRATEIIQGMTEDEAINGLIAYLRTIKAQILNRWRAVTGDTDDTPLFDNAFEVLVAAVNRERISEPADL